MKLLGGETADALGRFTPDSGRWRLRIAGLAAIVAPLAFYGAFAVASGVKSGLMYNLLIAVFGVLALVLPVVGAMALLAPDSDRSRTEPSGDDAVETLKRRYAAGEIDQAEFDRRLDDLLETPADIPDRSPEGHDRSADDAGRGHAVTDRELDRAGQ